MIFIYVKLVSVDKDTPIMLVSFLIIYIYLTVYIVSVAWKPRTLKTSPCSTVFLGARVCNEESINICNYSENKLELV